VTFNGFVNYSGALTIEGFAAFAANQGFTDLTLSGTLSGMGTVTVSGMLDWSGLSTMTGGGQTILSAGSTTNINAQNIVRIIDRTVVNNAVINHLTGVLSFSLGNGALINNGLYNLSSSFINTITSSNGSVGVFSNAGTFNKIGAGTAQIKNSDIFGGTLTFDNDASGIVNVDQGVLELSVTGTSGGRTEVDASGSLSLGVGRSYLATSDHQGPGIFEFAGGVHNFPAGTFSPSGTVGVRGASTTVTINEPWTASGLSVVNATVNLNASEIIQNVSLASGKISGSGQLSITNLFSWSGGQMEGSGATMIANSASLNVTGTGLRLCDRPLNVNGLLTMTGGGGLVLRVKHINAAPTAIINMNDNAVIVDYTAGFGSPLATVAALISSGRNFGDWLGNGITSDTARLDPNQDTTLGAIELADYWSVYGVGTPFAGQTFAPDADAVLVKYTYYGDTDFSGSVDGDDYARIDAGFNFGLGGWFNGDSDLNGFIDGDDYALIDLAFSTQGAPL
jgi:hypothetical protein